MRRLLHLVWFDFLALRTPLALWGVVLLLEAADFYVGPAATAVSPDLGGITTLAGLGILRMAATVILTALLVHADPTVGSVAFWRSRPIPRGVLLAAKLVSAALWLVLLPAIVTGVMLSLLGLPAAVAAHAAAAAAVEQAVLALLAMVGAVVTVSLLQFVIAMLVALAVSLAVGQLLPAFRITVDYRLLSVLHALPIVAIAGIVLYQYLTLRTRYSIAMIALVVVSVTAGGRLIDYQKPPSLSQLVRTGAARPTPAAGGIAPSQATFSALTDTQLVDVAAVPGRAPGRAVSFRIDQTDGPDGVIFGDVRIASDVQLPDGTRIRWSGSTYYWRPEKAAPASPSDPYYRSHSLALGGAELGFTRNTLSYPTRWVVLRLPEDVYRRLEGKRLKIESTVTMAAYRFARATSIPFRGRRAIPDASGVEFIEAIDNSAASFAVWTRHIRLSDSPGYWYPAGYSPMLWNPVRRQALFLRTRGTGSMKRTMNFAGASITSESFRLEFEPPAEGSSTIVDDAELARLYRKPLGLVTRTVKIDNFVLGPPTK